MAQRARDVREKSKTTPRAANDVAMPDNRIAALEAERDRLKAQLAEAEARIAGLEQSRASVVNRIDWLIDKLNSAVEKRA
jgi:uncharacterized small protein (DUF1192 family)